MLSVYLSYNLLRVTYFDSLFANSRIGIHKTMSNLRENLIIYRAGLKVSDKVLQLLQKARTCRAVVAAEQFHYTRNDFLLIFSFI